MRLGTKQSPLGEGAKSLVGFEIGSVHYAIDIEHVRAIVSGLETTSLPHMPPEIAGVADYRSEVVTIVDLRTRFGVAPTSGRQNRIILLRGAGATDGSRGVGLLVDAVTDVFGRIGELRPPPEVGGDAPVRGIVGVTVHAGRMTFVLDTTRIAAVARELSPSPRLGRGDGGP